MLALEEAQAFVVSLAAPLDVVSLPIADALGAVLAADVVAAEAIPPFANTAMDGYAVRAADTTTASEEAPVRLRVAGTTMAGMAPGPEVGPGEAVRIMTGAPMPSGADAVVMVERSRPIDDGDAVDLTMAVEAGTNVRPVGDDVVPGDVVMSPGEILGPGHLGVLASLGRTEVAVHRPPRVGVFSTGDELIEGGGPLAPGQIRDSNRVAICSLVRRAGYQAVDLGIVVDDATAIENAVLDAVASCDVVLTTGGVSMGDVDLVKVVLDQLGEMRWMQVAIRPAKPLAAGTVARADGTLVPVIGLPGNPVSSMVSFELFARPVIRRRAGMAEVDWHRRALAAVAGAPLRRRPDGKVHFLRVTAEVDAAGRLVLRPSGGQASHQLTAMARADGLAVLPDGDGVDEDADVRVLLLD